jgi:hypothetical protein
MRSAEKTNDILEYRQTQKSGNNWRQEQSKKSVYKIRRTAVSNSALQSTESRIVRSHSYKTLQELYVGKREALRRLPTFMANETLNSVFRNIHKTLGYAVAQLVEAPC